MKRTPGQISRDIVWWKIFAVAQLIFSMAMLTVVIFGNPKLPLYVGLFITLMLAMIGRGMMKRAENELADDWP